MYTHMLHPLATLSEKAFLYYFSLEVNTKIFVSFFMHLYLKTLITKNVQLFIRRVPWYKLNL